MKHSIQFRFLIILLLVPFPLFAQWAQKGSDINGAAANHYSGRSVCISGDGATVVIGSPGDGSGAFYTGTVRVFRWIGTSWQQLGATLNGDYAGNQFGNSVSINAAGTIIAIGMRYGTANGGNPGHVRVYEWDGTTWTQLGVNINGLIAGDVSNVSLNADGNIVAIGAPHNMLNGAYSGYVRVFEWSSGIWIPKGGVLYAEAMGDFSGQSVSLNNEGDVLAIGAPQNGGNGLLSGHVRIYEWNGASWIQKGNDIDGEHGADVNGSSVSISGDGNTVAMGAPGNSDAGVYAGQARVFTFNGTIWEQKGADIDGHAAEDGSGISISLSDGGDTVAIGAAEDTGPVMGYTHIYSWDGTSWIQVGNDILANGSGTGQSVSLNNSGTIVAIGAHYHSGGGIFAGQVTVFENLTVGISEIGNSLVAVYPNPSFNEITIDLGQRFESVTLTIKNNIGQILRTETFYDVEKIQHDFKLSPGYYFAEITSGQEYIATARFLKM